MGYATVDDFASPWTADSSGLWRASTTPTASSGFEGPTLSIDADPVGDLSAWVERIFTASLDLTSQLELRFWIRCSIPATGPTDRPFYLRFSARSDAGDTEPGWFRLIPVTAANRWELVRLWIEEMPTDLRASIGSLRFESWGSAPGFSASVFQLIACRPSAIADVEQSLVERFTGRFSVESPGGPQVAIPVVSPGPSLPSATEPTIVITPISIEEIVQRDQRGAAEIDNYTPNGAHRRTVNNSIELTYAIDAATDVRSTSADAQAQVVADLLANPVQLVANDRVTIESFDPGAEVRRLFLAAGRSPYFVRLVAPIDTVERSFHPWSQPMVEVGPGAPPRDSSEPVPV